MPSYSDYDSINFLGKINCIDNSLNKFRLLKGWYNGFYTLIPKSLDTSLEGIFIPSLCTLTESTIDLIRKLYGPQKRIIDRDFLMYIYDEEAHLEGIWLPLDEVCEYLKIDATDMLSYPKVTLEILKRNGIIQSYDYFTRIMGANDIRFVNIDEQQINIHELIHGDIFKISKSLIFKNLKISNTSIDKNDFKDLEIFNMEIYMVRPNKDSGPVNFHVSNTFSYGKFGKYLNFSYNQAEKYYLKTVVKENKNISYNELNNIFEGKFNLSPKLYTIFADKNFLIKYCDGRVKRKSTVGDYIMKGFELFGKDGKPYTYLSPLYLASCAESTIWC